MISRFLPLVGMILFLGIGLFWRAWLHYRRHGNTGIILSRSTGWQGLRVAVFLLLLLAVAAQTLAFALDPEWMAELFIIAWPPFVTFHGAKLLLIGLILLVIAQLGLGASWRIGIDEGARPGLVTGGLYRFSRNPIFLAMILFMIGLTILIPTWVSLAFLVAGILGIRSQVLEEESYLLRTYGDDYRAYAASVGRFLPGLGRLRGAN